MMIQHPIVKLLSAACILLAPVIMAKSENKFMQYQGEQGNTVSNEDKITGVSVEDLQKALDLERDEKRNLAKQLEDALTDRQEAEASRDKLEETVNSLQMEVNTFKQTNRNDWIDAKKKLEQKEQELTDLKREFYFDTVKSDEQLNELRNSYDTELSRLERQLVMSDDCMYRLVETTRSLSTCETMKYAKDDELKLLRIEKNNIIEKLEKEVEKLKKTKVMKKEKENGNETETAATKNDGGEKTTVKSVLRRDPNCCDGRSRFVYM